jgi:hypothetical protein
VIRATSARGHHGEACELIEPYLRELREAIDAFLGRTEWGAARAAEGSTAEALRLESLLRQLEYQAGLAAARGERPIDTEWLRTELGLTVPLSERLP